MTNSERATTTCTRTSRRRRGPTRSRDSEFGWRFLERHQESLLFATDCCVPGLAFTHVALFDRFELEGDVRENFAHRDLERLLL